MPRALFQRGPPNPQHPTHRSSLRDPRARRLMWLTNIPRFRTCECIMAALFLIRARPLPTAHTHSISRRLPGPASTSADTGVPPCPVGSPETPLGGMHNRERVRGTPRGAAREKTGDQQIAGILRYARVLLAGILTARSPRRRVLRGLSQALHSLRHACC